MEPDTDTNSMVSLASGPNTDTDSMVRLALGTDTNTDSMVSLALGTDTDSNSMVRLALGTDGLGLKSDKIIPVSYRHRVTSNFLATEYARLNLWYN